MDNHKTEIEGFVIDRVRELRISKGISQAELADCINISRGFIGNVENPRLNYKYNLNHLNAIAKVLKCSIKDFFPDGFL